LTKQFHPARFSRYAPEIHKMANEVFLGIKGAHDHLVKVLGSTGRAPPRSSSVPASAPTSYGTVRGTGLVPKTTPGVAPPARGTTDPLTRGTDRSGVRPSSPVLTTPSGGLPRAASPLTTPSAGNRAPTPPQTTQPLPRASTPGASSQPPRSPTPAIGIPIQRPTSPSTDGERRPTPIGGVPVQRPTGQLPPLRQQTPPRAADGAQPPTIRYGVAQPTQSGSMPKQSTEDAELQHAMSLLSSNDWTAARLAFHALAAKVPQSRQYRALLCYARGRETQATGRNDDAAMEFQRALQLDPELALAKAALAEVQRRR
jgi:hypothetical protein